MVIELRETIEKLREMSWKNKKGILGLVMRETLMTYRKEKYHKIECWEKMRGILMNSKQIIQRTHKWNWAIFWKWKEESKG